LCELKPLLELTEIKFVNLQYKSSKDDIEEIRRMGLDIINFPDVNIYDDIESLCSIIDACDFVVTISNINAHLAGALGKETYLLSAKGKAKHFYWQQNQEENLWYPSVKIFEQSNFGDWSIPIDKIVELIKLKNYG
jgi:ADP-heptose:LPS heptosyltransferase